MRFSSLEVILEVIGKDPDSLEEVCHCRLDQGCGQLEPVPRIGQLGRVGQFDS